VEGWRTTDSTRDEKLPLVFGANPFQLDFLDVATRRLSPLPVYSTFSLMHARLSPDMAAASRRTKNGEAKMLI
jgi:hypothetical protein